MQGTTRGTDQLEGRPRSTGIGLAVAFVSLVTVALPAHAYLDPSTGSMILSAIVGLFATIGLALKTYWYKFKNLFVRRQRPAEDPAPSSPDAPKSAP